MVSCKVCNKQIEPNYKQTNARGESFCNTCFHDYKKTEECNYCRQIVDMEDIKQADAGIYGTVTACQWCIDNQDFKSYFEEAARDFKADLAKAEL